MRFDFIASSPQFEHHLRPVYEGLPEDAQGTYTFLRNASFSPGDHEGRIVVAAAIGDFRQLCRKRTVCTIRGHFDRWDPRVPLVLFEHGAGFSFHGDPKTDSRPGSYAGGLLRGAARLLPATNRYVAETNARYWPDVPGPIVGCPKLDALKKIRRRKPKDGRPVVCISFHWDCRVAPETRWAYSYYAPRLLELRDHPDFELVAHGHPRLENFWRKSYGMLEIPYLETFEEVARKADVYVNDSSSTLYEFAALGRPVVTLNAPWFRREVQHGLRFWEHADVGVQVDEPEDLVDGILEAITDRPAQKKLRREAVRDVYPHLGSSVPRAVEALLTLREELA